MVDSVTDYLAHAGRAPQDSEAALEGDITALAADLEPGGGELRDGATGSWLVGDGETLSVEGGDSGFGGLVILDGEAATLSLEGNQCFSGLVLTRNGGVIDARGTPAIVGAVKSIAGRETALNGNPSFLYSSQALDWARGVHEGTVGGGLTLRDYGHAARGE